ncbi:MAG: S8 family serine peptidase [Verrucomicrobiota bacterium]|jgi:subtilisin family serine protease|nr:S8 family serine peptidase [Verrucomicrobiota bacterium]
MKRIITALGLFVAAMMPTAKEALKPNPGDALNWRPNGTATVQIEQWPLEKVLQSLSNQGSWEVFVEPDLEMRITTRFKDLEHPEALRRLLSNLNFAVIPTPGDRSKLLVYKTSSTRAVVRIIPAKRFAKPEPDKKKKKTIIPNELVITLKPGSGIDIEALAEQLGAEIVGEIEGLGIYRLRFENEQLAEKARTLLGQNDGVASIDSNFGIIPPDTLSPVALSAPPLNLRPSAADDDGIVIGLIDSSVQRNGSRVGEFLLPEISMAGEAADRLDHVNHGTSMAETILRGLSSSLEDTRETSVKILPVDVYGQSENTSTFAVAQGVQAAIEAGADIISLSLGSDEQNPLMRSVIQAGSREGVLFLAAAGNEPTGMPVFPAAQPEVVGVTALNLSGRDVANYANTGAFVEAAAPGAGVTVFNNQTYFGTGTSFSTAYVAGVAAGISSIEGIPVQQVRGLIATEMKPPGP